MNHRPFRCSLPAKTSKTCITASVRSVPISCSPGRRHRRMPRSRAMGMTASHLALTAAMTAAWSIGWVWPGSAHSLGDGKRPLRVTPVSRSGGGPQPEQEAMKLAGQVGGDVLAVDEKEALAGDARCLGGLPIRFL